MSKCLVFIATAWGSRYGGINSFNYDLCVALAKLAKSDLNIVCIVSESKDGDKQDAEETGVTLICLKNQEEEIEILPSLLKDKDIKPAWIIGHDVHSEPRASKLSKYLNIPLALFHHMDYAAYKSLEVLDDEIYVAKQKQTLRKAKIIFAVGPKLLTSARKLCGKTADKIIEVLPGLRNDLETESALPEKFHAITLGRLEAKTDLLKQTSLAVAGFANAVSTNGYPLGHEPELTVLGFQNDEEEDRRLLKSIAKEYTDDFISYHLWSFKEKRAELFEHLCGQTACMMLSLHEGFGLVGLEAISAEVPLILSENSGLYRAIKTTLGGEGLGCLFPIRVSVPNEGEKYHRNSAKEVSSIILRINSDKKDAKENAVSLKQKLAPFWAWEKAARAVLNGLGLEDEEANSAASTELLPTQSRSNPIQDSALNDSSVPIAPQLDEDEKQLSSLHHQESPQLRIVSNQSVSSKAEIPNLRKEVLNLKRDIDRHLGFLENTEIKRILEEDLPYPQWFESITEYPIPIETILQTVKQLVRTSEKLECIAQLNDSFQLIGQSKLAFNNCLQQITTLRQCSNRRSSRYVTALRQARDSFELATQNLRDANSVLEQLVFLI